MKAGNLKKLIERYQVLIFFLMGLAISWSIWIPMALDQLNIIQFKIPIIVGQSIGAFGPLISLFILDKISKGAIGLKEIFDSIRIKGERIIWLIPAALILPLLTILGNIINFFIGNESQLNILKSEPLVLLGYGLFGVIPLLLFAGLFSSPLFEEPCWRGYGLRKLQGRFGRHIGSLLLGTYWWLWHQPINIANGLEVNLYSYLLMLSYSFIFDSIYNLSNKNLLSAMFAHSSAIVTYTFIYQSDNLYVLLMFLIVIITLRILEWKRRESISAFKEEQVVIQPEKSL
ncbi:MAG: CPBP family intramembrane metalloprotease [Promethearchaeota archaeon]|nr:MAG: CPBP family intramembrane metalloprotease [Candidatus Lokiarchaeota archaeon]